MHSAVSVLPYVKLIHVTALHKPTVSLLLLIFVKSSLSSLWKIILLHVAVSHIRSNECIQDEYCFFWIDDICLVSCWNLAGVCVFSQGMSGDVCVSFEACVWSLEHVAKGLSLITEITFLKINIWRLQAVKLTPGCEIKEEEKSHWGESTGCSGAGRAALYLCVYCNSISTLDRVLLQVWRGETLGSGQRDAGSISEMFDLFVH